MIAMKINKRNSTIRDYTVYLINFYTDYMGKDSDFSKFLQIERVGLEPTLYITPFVNVPHFRFFFRIPPTRAYGKTDKPL